MVRVSRQGNAALRQVAGDLGISEGCLLNWLNAADVVRSGLTEAEPGELRDTKRRNRVLEQENEILRRVAAFYKWKANTVSDRDWDDAHLINVLREIHDEDPAFGCQFIVDELERRGITASDNRVQRLCHKEHIWSALAKKRGLSRLAGAPVHDDRLEREFTATGPNERWVGDITAHPTAWIPSIVATGRFKARLVVFVRFPRPVVEPHDRAARCRRDPQRRCAARRVGHDRAHRRGSQFRALVFLNALRQAGLVGPMGRVEVGS